MSTAPGHNPARASTSTAQVNGHAGSSTEAFNQAQLFAAIQAQAVAASMLGQNPLVSNILGTNVNINPFMTQFSSQHNSQGLFTGVNPMQSGNLLGAMLQQQQQQQSVATQFNMGQLLNDAIKLSSPVGSKPNDEELLIQALCESEKKGGSYLTALEGMHGTNDHAANVWKDHYLDNHRRINDMVAQRLGLRRIGFAKRPKFDDKEPLSNEYSPPLARPSKPLGRKVDLVKIKRERYPDLKRTPSPPPRRRSPSVEKIPLRCPTPPTEVIYLDAAGRAARYTEADRNYLVSYSRWRLHGEPNLTKDSLARELAQKVPHHSVESWKRHISRRDKELDAIYEEARKAVPERRESEDDTSDTSTDDDDAAESASRTHHDDNHESEKEYSDEADDEDDEEDDDKYSKHGQDFKDRGDDDTEESDHEQDVRRMSGPRKPFNDADRRVMARYIVSIPDWDDLSSKDRWGDFAQLYPQRNAHAWAQIHRTRLEEVELEVLKYRRRTNQESENGSPAGTNKRAHSEVDNDSATSSEDEAPLSKRSRHDGSSSS